MEEIIKKKRYTPIKKRSQSAYNNKVKKLTDRYNNLLKFREKEIINPNTKLPTKRKELKPLDYYIGLLKQVKGD